MDTADEAVGAGLPGGRRGFASGLARGGGRGGAAGEEGEQGTKKAAPERRCQSGTGSRHSLPGPGMEPGAMGFLRAILSRFCALSSCSASKKPWSWRMRVG